MTAATDKGALTAERLREVLDFDADTGAFTWRIDRSDTAKAGCFAGRLRSDGYVSIAVDGRPYLAHRLAILYTHGRWPAEHIDHINCDRADNRLANLREATCSENSQNQRRAHRNGKAGLLGVKPSGSKTRPWKSQITLDGKGRHLGNFATKEEAHAAYLRAKAELHPFQTLTSRQGRENAQQSPTDAVLGDPGADRQPEVSTHLRAAIVAPGVSTQAGVG